MVVLLTEALLVRPCRLLSAYYDICVRILQYMCPHTTIYVSAYYYISVLVLLYMCPHTTIYVPILLYMCPQVGASARVLLRPHCCRHTLYHSVYLLYQYKSTDTDAAERCMLQAPTRDDMAAGMLY